MVIFLFLKIRGTLETLKNTAHIPSHTSTIDKGYGYFSNTDKECMADLNHMYANQLIEGILCSRRGLGCTRVLHKTNYELIKNNPKVLIVFSDVP
ncbi:LD-carboxypeptidase [Maribacter aestuarii]|uniref:LD-carboxypeptidase n=1 Tax=Maribacter aestuarii TaxID=1130723 RepID=UPI00248C3B96|nr:LD-carboxypeptidase [Maribacter aestuarii]